MGRGPRGRGRIHGDGKRLGVRGEHTVEYVRARYRIVHLKFI